MGRPVRSADPGGGTSRLALTGLTTATVLVIAAGDFVTLLIFWELSAAAAWGVAARSVEASEAARRMWVVQRAADVPLIMAIVAVGLLLGTWSFSELAAHDSGVLAELLRPDLAATTLLQYRALVTLAALGMFAGVAGRFAFFPLFGGARALLAAMPPVDVLRWMIFVAPPGLVVLARTVPLLSESPQARVVVTALGLLTALLAVLVAWAQPVRSTAIGFGLIAFFAGGAAAIGTARSEAIAAAILTTALLVLVSPVVTRSLIRIDPAHREDASEAAMSPVSSGALRRLGARLFFAEELFQAVAVWPLRFAILLAVLIDRAIAGVLGGRLMPRLLRVMARGVDGGTAGASQIPALALVLGAAVLALLLLRGGL